MLHTKEKVLNFFDAIIEKIKVQTTSLLLNAKIEVQQAPPVPKQEYKPIEVRKVQARQKLTNWQEEMTLALVEVAKSIKTVTENNWI